MYRNYVLLLFIMMCSTPHVIGHGVLEHPSTYIFGAYNWLLCVTYFPTIFSTEVCWTFSNFNCLFYHYFFRFCVWGRMSVGFYAIRKCNEYLSYKNVYLKNNSSFLRLFLRKLFIHFYFLPI